MASFGLLRIRYIKHSDSHPASQQKIVIWTKKRSENVLNEKFHTTYTVLLFFKYSCIVNLILKESPIINKILV